MEILEAPAFTRHMSSYLNDEEYRRFQIELANDPELGDVMPGTGGFRKVRWVDERRGKGRRGGLRIIYYYFESTQQRWLITIYDKSEAADLGPQEKKALKAGIGLELKMREAKRLKLWRKQR